MKNRADAWTARLFISPSLATLSIAIRSVNVKHMSLYPEDPCSWPVQR
jgi:hypothetical protein